MPFHFVVTLSAPSEKAVTVGFATADGTARVSDGDYAAASGTLTFAAGGTRGTVTVFVPRGQAEGGVRELLSEPLQRRQRHNRGWEGGRDDSG